MYSAAGACEEFLLPPIGVQVITPLLAKSREISFHSYSISIFIIKISSPIDASL